MLLDVGFLVKNTCRFKAKIWIVIIFMLFVTRVVAESDTAKITVKLTLPPTIKAFIKKPSDTLTTAAVTKEDAGDDLSTAELCFSQRGLVGFELLAGKYLNQALIHSNVMSNKGCYLPFSQITEREIQQVSDHLNQQIILTISPL